MRFRLLRLKIACFLLAICPMTSMVGCGEQGPEYFPVQGKVIFKQDSSAAQFGRVEFRSQSDPPVIARGKIQKDGSFQLQSNGKRGTVRGMHTVVIIQVIGGPRQGQSGAKIVHDHGLDVAKKYSDHRTSDLEVDVQPETCRELVFEVDAK